MLKSNTMSHGHPSGTCNNGYVHRRRHDIRHLSQRSSTYFNIIFHNHFLKSETDELFSSENIYYKLNNG